MAMALDNQAWEEVLSKPIYNRFVEAKESNKHCMYYQPDPMPRANTDGLCRRSKGYHSCPGDKRWECFE